ncbi:MAG: porin [Shewanellaceae bacterium]|nr:porin [Shewanellaceae bacterium]
MKKLYLSASIAALLAAGSVQATEVYNKDGNTVDVGGYISLQALSMPTLTDEQKKTVKPMGFGDNGSRFNLGFGHDLGNGWKSMGKIEYAFNGTGEKFTSATGAIDSDNDQFTNRLAYLAFGHGTYGTVYVGKTWSTFSDVASVTETGAVYAPVWGMYGLGDGSWEGTGRAKNVLQYRVTIPAANNMRLGLQYQPVAQGEYAEEEFISKFGGGFGLSLVVPVMPELEVGVAYQMSAFEYKKTSGINPTEDYDKGANAMAVSVKYGSFEAPGFHMGLTYSLGENLGKLPTGLAVTDKGVVGTNDGALLSAPKSNQIAVVGSFNVNKFVPFVGYYMTTFESEAGIRDIIISGTAISTGASTTSTMVEKATSNSLVVGAHYLWSDNFSIFAEYSMDMSSEITTKADEAVAAAVLTDDGKKHYETTNSPHGFTMGFKFVF